MFRTFHPIFIFVCNNTSGMWRVSDNLGKLTRGLLWAAALAGLCCPQLALADDPPAPATPPVIYGHYKVIVRGFITGTGNATVGGGTVSISATVKSSNGQTSSLAVNCTMDGDHFTGKGVFLNMAVTIEGRVEGADPGNKSGPVTPTTGSGVVTDAHIGATFRLADGHSGRIVGVMDHAAQVGG